MGGRAGRGPGRRAAEHRRGCANQRIKESFSLFNLGWGGRPFSATGAPRGRGPFTSPRVSHDPLFPPSNTRTRTERTGMQAAAPPRARGVASCSTNTSPTTAATAHDVRPPRGSRRPRAPPTVAARWSDRGWFQVRASWGPGGKGVGAAAAQCACKMGRPTLSPRCWPLNIGALSLSPRRHAHTLTVLLAHAYIRPVHLPRTHGAETVRSGQVKEEHGVREREEQGAAPTCSYAAKKLTNSFTHPSPSSSSQPRTPPT